VVVHAHSGGAGSCSPPCPPASIEAAPCASKPTAAWASGAAKVTPPCGCGWSSCWGLGHGKGAAEAGAGAVAVAGVGAEVGAGQTAAQAGARRGLRCDPASQRMQTA
jgi:hypothetical protein